MEIGTLNVQISTNAINLRVILCYRSIYIGKAKHNYISIQSQYVVYSTRTTNLIRSKIGIKKLNNTISWELTSESAIKLEVIEKCYLSLRTPASNKVSYKVYHATKLKDTTDDTIAYYENWLLDAGSDILFFFYSM